jgi:hypothetical protein
MIAWGVPVVLVLLLLLVLDLWLRELRQRVRFKLQRRATQWR